MGTPFLGEIKIISWNYAPKAWAFCNGQFLPIAQNQALFSLFGTMYGGNGQTTFALPDLRGRVANHVGGGFVQGQASGQASHTLTIGEMPAHNHFLSVRNAAPGIVGGNVGAATKTIAQGLAIVTSGNQAVNLYSQSPPNQAMHPSSTVNFGGSQPHENRQPYLVLNHIVALQGIFPSRN
ncbi:MAG TPA: tail fiber protein [Allosphingosinicella sp.]|nr:tail fiber protein [Allosphingosinicella sp.]